MMETSLTSIPPRRRRMRLGGLLSINHLRTESYPKQVWSCITMMVDISVPTRNIPPWMRNPDQPDPFVHLSQAFFITQ